MNVLKSLPFLFAFLGLVSVCTADESKFWPEARADMKPWAYNWWMGSSVDEAGLARQVADMQAAGLGGFHVIPIYAVKDDPSVRKFLSPEWMKAFGDAVRLAGERGLGVDLTTGSGWCFGGPQLAREDGGWMLELDTKHPEKSLVLWRGEKDGQPVTLSARPTGQAVKRAGHGGRGVMMNPLSTRAMAKFLAPFKAAFGAPGAPRPRNMYHDSYEYFRAGWSAELPDAFARRRGYRLEDHYAALAGVGDPDTVSRVKCDYRETLSDLIVEEVFPLWTDWCRSLGMGTRNEAHGSPANWLDFYALADVPETEMFGCDRARARAPAIDADFLNSGDRDILVSKFASSAAHVKHAGADRDPLVSAESCTWVCEHFCETLGAIKTFVDRLFLAGVNHVFYHGTCYSPADAKWPGRTFYATCEMNRFNPIWRDADLLNAYIARVQSVARAQANDNDLLVYWPLHDYWSEADGFECEMSVHRRDWFTKQPIGRIARRLYDEGYAFDYASARSLATLPTPEKTRYTTILVPQARRMKPETLKRFFTLAAAGYRVLFVGGFPVTVPGFKDVAAREAELKKLLASAPANVAAGAYENLLASAPLRREPFNAANGLRFTRRVHRTKSGPVTSYFIANQNRDAGVKGRFKPSAPCRSAELMDPMTGAVRELATPDGTVELDLPIGHSVILQTRPFPSVAASARAVASGTTVPLDGTWTRTAVAGGPDFPAAVSGRLPLPWGGGPETEPEGRFSGTMRYETTVALAAPPADGCATLDLGRMGESAKVYVNGAFAGGVILPPWRVRLPAKLFRKGANTLAVETTSTGANRLRWLDKTKPYAWKVFEDINMVNINYRKFDASGWEARPAGLWGPVTLSFPPNG